jgi:hypothetical protein
MAANDLQAPDVGSTLSICLHKYSERAASALVTIVQLLK